MAKSFLCLNLTKLYTHNQIKEVLFHTSWNISSYVYPIHEEKLLEFFVQVSTTVTLVYSFENFLLIMQLVNRNEELWKEILFFCLIK